MERNLPGLEAVGLAFIPVRPAGWDGLWATIREIGAACGVPERAEALVGQLRTRASALAELVADVQHRPRVYWENRRRAWS